MKNLLNLRWLHGSPNQTGETLTRENRLGIATCLNPMRTLFITLLLLTLGVGQMWGGTNGNNIAFNNCYFYFNPYYDATHTVNKGYIQLSARKYQYSGGDDYGWWTATTTFSNVANTRLYYASTLEGTAWGDTDKRFHGWAIISNSDKKAASASDEWWNSSTWASDFKAYGLNSNTTYLFQASSSTKGQTIETTSAPGYLSAGWSGLNKTITVKAKVSTNNGSSYAETTSPATLSASSKKFTAHNTCTTNTSLSSGTITCGYTATTTLTAPSTDPTGYTWVGWYNSSGTRETTEKTLTIYPTANATYYAYYKANQYNGTIKANGGAADESYTATYSTTSLTSITAPTRTGYYITGYYDDAEGSHLVATAAGVLQKNVTGFTDSDGKWNVTSASYIYPQWDNHYTVTFNQHEPSFAGTESTTATYGSAMPSITVPSKTGYTFGGYYTGTNGSGTRYYDENGESVTNWAIAANTTLHAKWEGISYQVAFDANEGSGNMANEDFTYGAASKALTTNTFTRTGYYFLGWNSNADGSGTKYYDGKSVQNLTSVAGGIVTLYAQWAKTYTLYFLNEGTSGWNQGGTTAATIRYAYAFISYDNHEMYPLGTWASGTRQGTRMTAESSIRLSNVSGGVDSWCWSIANVPEGASLIFSDNNNSHKTGNLSGWTSAKPYYCNGNGTWYALDGTNTISKMTEMSVKLFLLTGDEYPYSEAASYDCGIDLHGSIRYAIKELPAGRYKYKYYNWRASSWSGSANEHQYIMDMNNTRGYNSPAWDLNGSNGGYDVFFYTTVDGEYKFRLDWVSGTPKTTLYYPVSVSLGLSVTQALAGAETTVRLTASPGKPYLRTHPTYYYQISTDNGNTWTNIAETSNTTYDYTFAARKSKFRVILKNDEDLQSKSDEVSFTTYSTKSFYVYNPYNNASDKWQTLHLYTWDSNDGNKTYNGSWPGKSSGSCINDNNIVSMGGDWYYITINENANCFMLVGDSPYSSHQTVTCYVSNYRADAKCMIYTESNLNKVVAYKAKGASDYRLKYTYGSPAKHRYSPIYNTTLDGTTVTASMWMDASSGTSLTIQQGTGNDTWADRKTYTNSSNGFGGLVDSEHRNHGYVFQMQVTLNTGAPTNSSVSNVALYNGSYYVRTDGLNGGWNDYKKSDHTMHHSAKSLDGTPAYDYYLCKWIGSRGTNVKFTVANDYNPELVESLEGDVISTDPLYNQQTIPQATNVRFSWNTETNTLTRAYLSAATEISERFLMLVETSSTKGKIYNDDDGLVPANNELIFADMGNWVYQLAMKANPGAYAKVTAKYNNKEQEFIPSTQLISGTGSSKYSYRIIYDFKTNILTNAWVADGATINTTIDLNTNVMVIRNGQGTAAQIHFGKSGNVINAKKLVSVMQFEYDNMVGKMNSWNSTAYQYCMYYISFPFNVKVSDIFGIGEMGVDWRLQYYDGEERALKGFFEGDGTTTFWKDVPANGTLNAYEGYSLLLNRVKFNDKSTDIWENKGAGSSVYLYFPSTADAENIKEDEQTIRVPEHTCRINRTFTDSHGNEVNHMNTDSHWNMMGTPLFEDKTASTIGTPSASGSGATTLKYFYAWNASTNTLQAQAALDNTVSFSSMYSYMVQYAGEVTFRGSRVVPNAIAAREKVETKNYNIKLQVLDAEDNEINRTFVTLEEGASADFVLNEDMYMVTNKLPVNIYTFAGNYDVAGNVLPIESTTVPVGVIVKTAGTYTFSMPSHFDGTVTLVDTYAQTRTNLGIEDYTVNLEEGTFNSRFLLELNIHQAPTAIDGVSDGTLKDGKAHKFLQNGVMYILQNGVMYDAQGKRVK